MRQAKAQALKSTIRQYATLCADSKPALYKATPSKADFRAIVEYATASCGLLRTPYSYRPTLLAEWTKAYTTAQRAVKVGKPIAKAAPKPKASRKPKAQPKAESVQAVPSGLTDEQKAAIAQAIAQAVVAAL